VQSIISWETDEAATSRVYYEEVAGAEKTVASSTLDAQLTFKHFVVLTSFKPGNVYRYWVESTDAAGNTSRSNAYTILAPQEKETIVDIMIQNFEQIFGWTKKIGI
jgi:hypothetical protein